MLNTEAALVVVGHWGVPDINFCEFSSFHCAFSTVGLILAYLDTIHTLLFYLSKFLKNSVLHKLLL